MADEVASTTEAALISDEEVYTSKEGLTPQQVEEKRVAGYGNNVKIQVGRSTGEIIRANVFTRINAMLGVLFIIVLSTGSIINSAFGLLIIANAGIGIVQELRAKRTLERLSIVGRAKPTVRRSNDAGDSEEQTIPPEELVEGDLVVLSSGEQILVDGEVRDARSLTVDESLLTGENDPVYKEAGDVVLSGSFVVAGSGVYQATRVGKEAYANKLAEEASAFSLTNSQLMTGINRILRVITWLLIPTGILTIYTQLFQTGKPLRESILAMAAALVPMVPEGLVLMTSIAFALGVVRLGEKQCLVQELPAIEGLARVDVVCTDKTGTLTDNTMQMTEVRALGEGMQAPEVLRAMAAWDEHPNDSMRAILEWTQHYFAVEGEGEADTPVWEQTGMVPFSSDKKWSGMSFGDHGHWILGAPDVLTDPGTSAAQQAQEAGSTGRRIMLLAQAHKPVEELADVAAADFVAAGDVTPYALIILEQSIRPDAADTLQYFHDENVEVKVVSGDNAQSVGAVAQSLGMEGAENPYDARELPELPENAFAETVSTMGNRVISKDPEALALARQEPVMNFARDVEHHTVFGRVTPEQKRFMVGALQQSGHTVAMTGDGVNDVLALKRADIGVAMGSGSSAARSVAQIVLLDNKFATLPSVVAEGRRVIGNIERVANLFLTKTVYSVALAILVILMQVPFPFQPIHVTITGWFTIGIPAFLLSLAPNRSRAKDGFVSRVLRLAVPSGIIVSAVTFCTYLYLRHLTGGALEASMQVSTATLASLIISATWVLCVVARPLNWWKVLLVGMSAAMYPLIFLLPWTSQLFFLDAGNWDLMKWGLFAGVCGAVMIETLWWITGSMRDEKQFVWMRTRNRYMDELAEQRREESARVRANG